MNRIVIPGPPGTGKTLIWQCFAHEAGINCVSIGNLRNPYVGSSEQRTDAVFSYLDDLQPLVVIEDEADQSEASRDESTGDSGVSNRIRQKKFEFCSDPSRRGRIIWVRLTNRLDLIDSAYRRKGRTDEVMPFVLPEVGEMVDIFKVKFKEYGIVTSITDFSSFAMAAKERIYVTGADIDWMVREADMLATDKNEEIVRSEHLFQSISDWEMQADKIDMNRQIIMALKTGSKRFLPAGWQQILSEAQSRLSELTHAQGYVDDPNSGGSYQNSNFN